ncbi:Rap1a/Tai family immunity protein [Xanthomonas cucurbitae]|uniref:Rap1a immunity protein domain-containing protein n=1 Tax=Xanthomonas cucurbitae TaxID=56453 RepID=A0ABY7YCZ2_9XANT|nr:Rap1a/Tai family immunity protein [Xanthomonas cucurbitae]WDM67812.1 hypothetical protein K6981_00240 [Xanthomonas cucurbitae]WDM71686.1 hypothetical protein K6978_00235 [Xanthomonas cucurbitae]
MRSLTIVLAALLAALPHSVRAEGDGVTIGEMMENCQKPDGHFFQTYCFTYVGAVLDVQTLYKLSLGPSSPKACVPPTVLSRQAAAVFVLWAASNPARHHLPAAVGIVESMAAAFPCSAP